MAVQNTMEQGGGQTPWMELEVTGDWTGREIGAASTCTLCFVDPRGGAVWQ